MDEDDLTVDLEHWADPKYLADSFVATCDAGNCDLPTSAVVWLDEDEQSRWLSMCYGHAIKEMARPFLPE